MLTLFINKILKEFNKYKPFLMLISKCRQNFSAFDIEGARAGLLPFVIWNVHKLTGSCSLVLTETEKEAENIYEDLYSLYNVNAALFPWWGVEPYQGNPPLSSIFYERVGVLTRLLAGEKLIIVAPLRAFLIPLPNPEYLKKKIIHLTKKSTAKIHLLADMLSSFGYLRVPKVSVKGEFAVRGEVLDIFIPDGSHASRIVFHFDEVEMIRLFDPLTQISVNEEPDDITVFPLREVTFDDDQIEILKTSLSGTDISSQYLDELIQKIKINPEFDGVEMYFPLCFTEKYSLLDYLPKGSTNFLIWPEQLEINYFNLIKDYTTRYKRIKNNTEYFPEPEKILLDFSCLKADMDRRLCFTSIKTKNTNELKVQFNCDPPRCFFGNLQYFKDELNALIGSGYTIFIFAVYESQADRIRSILKDMNVNILPRSISSGFCIPDLKLIVIEESEIFGRKRRIPRSIQTAKSEAIDTFVDLEPGDFIVHLQYGIGRFCGIERIKTSLNERDYIHLEYSDNEIIYIPIEQVNLIQRYIAYEGGKPRLDKIGGKGWDRRKAKVKQSVEDLAERLLVLYAHRQKERGFPYPKDTEWQRDFEAAFPYQETEDQLRCIEEVKKNMEMPVPMDRLICGDVGYGKTEIALRAAFKAVTGGKQVALLAPTTILTEQHYQTFIDRFKDYPVKIEMLSRFRRKSEQKNIITSLRQGETDIIIGTHRLVQKDVIFKNLGLIIVDEEQRFGVKHKEMLKELKNSVDCLTLTATPIPRTLHMALMKIRDMSVLNTPPQNRLPIETHILEFDEEIIKQVIQREIERDGQIYFLHNRIETIMQVHSFLQKLVPSYSTGIAHGRMNTAELEDVMRKFVHRAFDILLTTTIIENGLDIPNVNTIIINRADMFGISQLYQLRGRVGRSDVPAYAYLLYPKDRVLSEIAMKRLRIISDYTELGSGFKIALKDLEIRGAGNLLGREQHGDILAVGFDMYVKLLDEAIAQKKDNKDKQEQDVYLELEYSGFIPDSYIDEPMEKMEVYKKIASISDNTELDRIYTEIVDRFGPLPDEVSSILAIAEIRIICKKLYISALKEKNGIITIEFSRLSNVPADKVVRLIQESGGSVFIDRKKPNCLCLRIKNIGLKEKADFLREKLSLLGLPEH